ncbi:MAG TPA: class I SAM-dependent methyltransferase [Chloroflexi bacterium]|jgi:SAM-dependent methyltransferase|nr:class I SAM-dependent methyltransferase [Chloroflexota bacterium]
MTTENKAIVLGHPSYVWREGQERRVALIRRYVPLENARILDAGCGLGLYVRRFRELSEQVYGVDLDGDKVRQARVALPNIEEASVDALPYPDGFFDVVFSHEVLEHVPDDVAAVRDAYRVLRPGGHMIVFVPNRMYPFETHGAYWGGRYHFGNIPLINYLPNRWRNQLAPHVRAYTRRGIRRLFDGLEGRIVVHRQVFAGYDNIVARRPAVGRLLRTVTYALERTPLQCFGLSHFIVYQKAG